MLDKMKQKKFKHPSIIFLCLIFLSALSMETQAQNKDNSSVNVQIVSDEAEAVVAILEKKASNEAITDADWKKLFSSEGFTRLKNREVSFKHQYTEENFKTFVLSASLFAKRDELASTLEQWIKADVDGAAQKALYYLPAGAKIKAKIYPVIKPGKNSFVFETKTDPAIFLYVNPAESKDKFENTLAHELHHIGYAASCDDKNSAEFAALPQRTQRVVEWVGAFGEGFAMLAAAGGPYTHPHKYSSNEDHARWDSDITNFDANLKSVDKFFIAILDGTIADKDIDSVGMEFMGIQGPWYTVGYKMSVLIEKTFGKQRLIDCMSDIRELLPTYNEAVIISNNLNHNRLPMWSDSVINAIQNHKAK
jgi:hypothetical protein